jgi:hypothetical protein
MITLASQGLTPTEIAARRREQRNRAARAYYSRNVGSCLLKGQSWKASHPREIEAANAARKAARAEARAIRELHESVRRPARPLIWAAARRAKRKNIPFDIRLDDLLPLPTHCPVLGLKLQYGPGRGRKLYENGCAASLDRIHNERGYVKGNVIVISLRANLLKGQATLDELQKIAAFYGRLS